MGVTVGTNAISVVHKSTHEGTSIKGFPDVCKTPSPAGPVPVPYPNAAGHSTENEAGTLKGLVTQDNLQLKTRLHGLHQEILSLPPGNPNRWHRLLDDYVILTAELYKKLSV